METATPRLRLSGLSTPRVAIGLIIFMFILFVLVLGGSILRAYGDANESAKRSAAAASQVVATNARWITELSRQALARIDETLGHDIESGSGATVARIAEAVRLLPGNVKAYVVAVDGSTLFSTDPNIQPIDIRDREYFRAVADGKSFHVSPLLVSRLEGNTQIFVFSRRIERQGEFVGAAMISFEVILLRDIWSSLELDEGSTVSFIRNDGQLVARYPFASGPLDLSNYILFTDYVTQSSEGVYSTISPADGVDRIVGYQLVPGTDLVALASVNMSSALWPFWRNTIVVLFFAVPTALALALAIFAIFRLLRRDERQRVQLGEALELNRMLVRDTHHRVKNNLQAIMSMVRLHGLPEEMKADLQNRVSAMTAVHEHLYRLDKFTEVDAATLIPAIVDLLVETFALPVTIDYDIDPTVLDRDHATPLALIVNEVVTNALKYAFKAGPGGSLRIALKRGGDGMAELTIADDGAGFDPGLSSVGLGGRLIRAMAKQLGADAPAYSFDGGTRFMLRFPLDAPDNGEQPAPDARQAA